MKITKKTIVSIILALAVVGCAVVACYDLFVDTTPHCQAVDEPSIDKVNSVKIDIEKLTPPTGGLKTVSRDKALKQILKDWENDSVTVFAHSGRCDDKLVSLSHPFFEGMHKAYAEHRPFVLSPDAVWTLICQGFALHVKANSDSLRTQLVNFDGKKMLNVTVQGRIDDPNNDWTGSFAEFNTQIGKYMGQELLDVLTADFSTTTTTTRAVTQVMVMSSMQNYFSYTALEACGIPWVILEGTADDWQKILDKTQRLRQYGLDWWFDELDPVLGKIAKAAQGERDKAFWTGMFKSHVPDQDECGAPSIEVDGWIVKFYPYYEETRRNLKTIADYHYHLGSEIESIPVEFIDVNGRKTPITLWAGFVGLTQDESTLALRPELGWFITRPK